MTFSVAASAAASVLKYWLLRWLKALLLMHQLNAAPRIVNVAAAIISTRIIAYPFSLARFWLFPCVFMLSKQGAPGDFGPQLVRIIKVARTNHHHRILDLAELQGKANHAIVEAIRQCVAGEILGCEDKLIGNVLRQDRKNARSAAVGALELVGGAVPKITRKRVSGAGRINLNGAARLIGIDAGLGEGGQAAVAYAHDTGRPNFIHQPANRRAGVVAGAELGLGVFEHSQSIHVAAEDAREHKKENCHRHHRFDEGESTGRDGR